MQFGVDTLHRLLPCLDCCFYPVLDIVLDIVVRISALGIVAFDHARQFAAVLECETIAGGPVRGGQTGFRTGAVIGGSCKAVCNADYAMRG